MLTFSSIYTPTQARHGGVFSARQYPRQAFGNMIDPVLNIDWFEMNGPTFPPHPHAGFSAVTYVFADSPNGFVNRDSMGDVMDIRPGGLHWSRASSGMMHEEVPMPGRGPARGLQIFINLPAANQRDEAAAFSVPPELVETRSGPGWKSRVAVNGTTLGKTEHALPSPVRVEEITLDGSARHSIEVPAGWGGILVVLEGRCVLGETPLSETQAIGFASSTESSFQIETSAGPARFVVISGVQLKQPVVAHGPLMLADTTLLQESYHRVSGLHL